MIQEGISFYYHHDRTHLVSRPCCWAAEHYVYCTLSISTIPTLHTNQYFTASDFITKASFEFQKLLISVREMSGETDKFGGCV